MLAVARRGGGGGSLCKIRDTRVIHNTHVNTYLAGTDDCQTGTGPGKPGPLPVFRQSNGPGPGPVQATDSDVYVGPMTTLHTILISCEGKGKESRRPRQSVYRR